MEEIEAVVVHGVEVLKLIVELIGVVVIAIGVVMAAFESVKSLVLRRDAGFNQARLTLARYLALALEFQLGADLLGTAIAPSGDEIGKLGAIAVIRTGLNFFLMREMKEHESGHHEGRPHGVGAESAEVERP